MNNISNYIIEVKQNPLKHIGTSKDLDYVKRLNGLMGVIMNIGNRIEYGTTINTLLKLSAADKLVIYSNIVPYFLPNRAKYSDISLLIASKNEKSPISLLPLDIVYHILKIKNQCGFMSYSDLFNKQYNI